MTSVLALEEAKLLCAVGTSDTGTGTIIPPQVALPRMCFSALEVDQTVSSNAYLIMHNGFMLFNSWGMNKR
jgi:hypothetical protein